MKRLIFFAAGLMMMTSIWAKTRTINNPYDVANVNQLSNYNNIENAYYGINVYQSSTGSGYGPCNNLNLNVQRFNRVFELGLMIDAVHQKVTGFEFMYKHFLGFHSANYYRKAVKLFFDYNFLYRLPATTIVDPSYMKSPGANPAMLKGKVTTFEHSVGLGAQISVFKQLYLETSAGLGVYFGAHYQGSAPNTWGIHKNNYGYVPSFKVGIGFQF